VKKELGLEEDDIIDIYHSLVKHEICLMRLGDICATESDGGYYVAKHGFSVRHNVDAQMTIVDVLYAMLVESDALLRKFEEKELGPNDVEGFVNIISKLIHILIESRLLIDVPCADKRALERLDDVLSGKSVIELNDNNVDNVYMYFDMLDHMLSDKLFNRLKVVQKEQLYPQYVEKIKNLIQDWKRKGVCFKTAHGELIKLLRYEAPLPVTKDVERSLRRVLEAYVLPFLEEPLPESNRSLESIRQKLGDRYSKEIDVIIGALKGIGIKGLREYQFVMLDKMFSLFDRPKIVVISAPTASGKTEIFMTYLAFKILVDDGAAVIIYPTKTLARQQMQRFIGFMYHINRKNSNETNHKTIHVYILDGDSPSKDEEVKGQPFRPFRGGIEIELQDENRKGQLGYNNKGKLIIKWDDGQEEEIEWVHERKEKVELKKPAIILTNDSMLSRHIHDGSDWVIDLAASLNTIVIDEAHMFMNDKKRSDFVHFLLLRLLLIALLKKIREGLSGNVDLYKDFKELIQERKLDIILSSATISDREVLKQGMSTRQLGGIDLAKVTKAASDSSGSSAPPYELLLRGWIKRAYEESDQGEKNIIFESYYDKIGSSKRKRLYVTAVYFPEPMSASRTPFIEALATTTIWTAAVGKGLGHRLHAIAFVDSKDTLQEIFRDLIRRGLSQECFHADKLLVSPLFHMQNVCRGNIGHKYIETLLTRLNPKRNTDESYQLFTRYSHLQLYYKWKYVKKYIHHMRKLLNLQQRQQSPDIIKEAEKIVKEAESFARDVYEAASRYEETSSNGSRYYIFKPKDGSGGSKEYYILQHHADLEKTDRQEIEEILSKDKDNWNLVIATSTLELGVDIPGVAVVLQYGAPPSGESFVQRVGRSGRDEWSYMTAFGAVFARNVGKDVMLIDEMEAIRSLYNLTRLGYSSEPDIETLARYMALIYFDGAIIKTIGAKHSLDDPIVQALLKLYYLDGDKKISETLDIFKKMVENSKRYKQILEEMLRSGEINKLRGMMPATPLFVKGGSRSDYMIVEKLEALHGKLARVMLNLGNEKRGRGQKYAEEIEKIEEEIRNLQGLQGKVLSLVEDIQQLCAKRGRLSISTYLHECATYIYDEFREKVDKPFRKIVDNINKIINVNKSSGLKDSLDETINAIEEFEQMILSTIIASDEICLSSRLHKDRHTTSYSYDDIMALLLGMPMPHPVFHSEPGNGCSLVFNEVEISHGKIKLKSELKGEIPGNANRVDVLSNVPFKHYEVP